MPPIFGKPVRPNVGFHFRPIELRTVRRLLVPFSLLLVLAGSDARGQIVKCTDPSGHVTYQQAACAAGEHGRAIDIKPDEALLAPTPWETAADAGRVLPGMPKRWVLRARGRPPDIRAATRTEQATEIWRYPQATTVLTVGFTGDAVVWVRDEPRPVAAPGVAPASAAAPAVAPASAATAPLAATGPRSAENRNSIERGRTCDSVLAAMGPPDRTEGVQVSAATLGGPDILVAATRYSYDAGAAANERTAFTCLSGKVAEVERAGAPKPTAQRPAPDR